MSDMVERVAKAIEVKMFDEQERPIDPVLHRIYLGVASAAIAIVIEDCALVAESESIDGCEWIVAKIAARIRSAPEDSATQSELEKLCSSDVPQIPVP